MCVCVTIIYNSRYLDVCRGLYLWLRQPCKPFRARPEPGLDNCATIVSSTDADVGLGHCSAMGSN